MNQVRHSMKQIDNDDQQRSKKQHQRKRRKFLSRKIFKRTLKFGLLAVVLVGGFLLFKLFSAAQSVVVDRGETALGLQGDIDPSQLQTEGDSRVNFLLIGVGGDNHDGGQLSDVNMVVSVDPVNKTVSMLSIPRDLYVDVPDHYATKINEAHALGEQREEGTGAKTLERTVEDMLDIELHYYVKADFQGFVDIVDALGGVSVDVDETLIDSTIEHSFGNDYRRTLYIEAGQNHFDGATALQYARCRKGLNCGNDFGRSERQQKLLQAIKDKALSLDTFSNPLKVGSVLDALGRHVRTNIDIYRDMDSILDLAEQIDGEDVDSFVLNNAPDNYLASSSIAGSTLVPKAGIGDFSEIQAFVKGDLFRDGFLIRENARVTVLNGTTIPGLASEVEERLSGLGYNVTDTDNAPRQTATQTTVYEANNNSSPYTRRLLELRMDTTVQTAVPAGLTSYSSDYIIVVGEDYPNAQ